MAKTLAIIFGVLFVIVGVLGFIPNPVVGSMGIFHTNLAHDLVHLVVGLVLLAVAFMAAAKSGLALKVFGVIYLLIAVLGFLVAPNGGMLAGLIDTNVADHLLHVVVGIVLLAAGFVGKGAMKAAPAPAPAAAPAPAPAPSSNPPMGGTM